MNSESNSSIEQSSKKKERRKRGKLFFNILYLDNIRRKKARQFINFNGSIFQY